jgi:hypothetical protein
MSRIRPKNYLFITIGALVISSKSSPFSFTRIGRRCSQPGPLTAKPRSTSSSSTALPIGPQISSGSDIARRHTPFSSRNMGSVDLGAAQVDANCPNAVNDEQHVIDFDLDGRQHENLAEFHRLYRQHGDRDGARGRVFCVIGRRFGHRSQKGERDQAIQADGRKTGHATPVDQPPAPIAYPSQRRSSRRRRYAANAPGLHAAKGRSRLGA